MKNRTDPGSDAAFARAPGRVLALGIALAAAAAASGAMAQGGEKSGREVVAATCGTCHATGEKNAPKIGDKAAWGKLAAQGLTGLTAVALKGIREMPAHGGSPGLSDTEIARAITYMVNKSGGKWIEPTNKTKPAGPMSGEQVVKMQCYQCHEQGIDGAPKIGDTQAWIPRLKNGLDATVLSAPTSLTFQRTAALEIVASAGTVTSAGTPVGSVMLAKDALGSLAGLEAVVIGRSNIVGKPVAQLLLAENCTVTIAHSKTKDLPSVVRRADLVIAAVGRAEMVKGDWLKPGACVIDVGINRIERDGKNRLVGDCDFASCEKVAGSITPVPGGVGPMTIACLLRNTGRAACAQKGIAIPEM